MESKSVGYHIRDTCFAIVVVIFAVLIVTPTFSLIMGAFMLQNFYEKGIKNKVQWAPLNVPLNRRLQSLVVSYFVFLAFFLIPILITLNMWLLYHLNNLGRAILIGYWIYIYYDHYTNFSATDGLGWAKLRNNILCKYGSAYFPVELVKTVDLTPDRNYIVACFPHGVIGVGVVFNVVFDISRWLKLFPGVRPKLATLDINFCVPIFRLITRAYGFVSSSKDSLLYYLHKSNDPLHPDNKDGFTSNALSIVIGGAKEASESKPGRYKLFVKDRKGFVKVAIMAGSSIVPSFTFNEVDAYDQVIGKPGSLLYYYQNLSKKMFKLWPTIIVGRGFFQYSFGLLPHRVRLVQVVGAPIDVCKSDIPDPKYVDEVHQKVIAAIIELFDAHKAKYLVNYKNAELVIN